MLRARLHARVPFRASPSHNASGWTPVCRFASRPSTTARVSNAQADTPATPHCLEGDQPTVIPRRWALTAAAAAVALVPAAHSEVSSLASSYVKGLGCCAVQRQGEGALSSRRPPRGGPGAPILPFDADLDKGLGSCDFQPLTVAAVADGSDASAALARKHFLLGLKLLHVFWFDVAAEQFQAAQRLAPGFAMAYWGEAMTYKEPLWQVEDLAPANEALRLMDERCDLSAVSPREAAYIAAARAYFRDGAKLQEREQGYSAAMEAINKDSRDADSAAFYGLSLLGMAASAQRYLTPEQVATTLLTARTELEAVTRDWPRHAGGLHYAVHAYDYPDLEVAARGRAPGLQLAAVAYRSCHAVHMVTHIALAFGEWRTVADANAVAVRASDVYCTQYGLGGDCDADNRYHALEWQHYALLQQGRVREATALLGRARDVANRLSSIAYYSNWVARMYAHQVMHTQDWQRRADVGFLPPPAMLSAEDRHIRTLPPRLEGGFWLSFSESMAVLAKAYQVVRNNVGKPASRDAVEGCLADCTARLEEVQQRLQAEQAAPYLDRLTSITLLQVEALRQVFRCRTVGGEDAAAAGKLWRPALDAALDGQRANVRGPDAPSITVSDVRELYGMLLNFMDEDAMLATEMFSSALEDLPNRLECLLGLARAQARTPGDAAHTAAGVTYRRIAEQCAGGDSAWGGLREARLYLMASATA